MTQDEYNAAFDAGYKKGFEAGNRHAEMHACAEQLLAAQERYARFNAAIDARIDAELVASKKAVAEVLLKGGK